MDTKLDQLDKFELIGHKLVQRVFEEDYPRERIDIVGLLLKLTTEIKKVINNELKGEVD